jgi:hypothetical protein
VEKTIDDDKISWFAVAALSRRRVYLFVVDDEVAVDTEPALLFLAYIMADRTIKKYADGFAFSKSLPAAAAAAAAIITAANSDNNNNNNNNVMSIDDNSQDNSAVAPDRALNAPAAKRQKKPEDCINLASIHVTRTFLQQPNSGGVQAKRSVTLMWHDLQGMYPDDFPKGLLHRPKGMEFPLKGRAADCMLLKIQAMKAVAVAYLGDRHEFVLNKTHVIPGHNDLICMNSDPAQTYNPTKLDIFHTLQILQRAMCESHVFYYHAMTLLRNAFAQPNKDDLARQTDHVKQKYKAKNGGEDIPQRVLELKLQKRFTRDRVRYVVPKPDVLLANFNKATKQIEDWTKAEGFPPGLFLNRNPSFWDSVKDITNDILMDRFSDPPGLDMYVNRGTERSPRYVSRRGTSSLESFHSMLNAAAKENNINLQTLHLKLADMICHWNLRAGINSYGWSEQLEDQDFDIIALLPNFRQPIVDYVNNGKLVIASKSNEFFV